MKTWTKDEIINALKKYDSFILRSIVEIYHRQTEDEKQDQTTNHANGIGFNGFDAKLLSSFAEQIIKYNRLSEKQMIIAKKKIFKYAKQITSIANIKEQSKALTTV
jgi:hypothetical protein